MKWAAITLLALMTACAPAYAGGHNVDYDAVVDYSDPATFNIYYIPVEGEEHVGRITRHNDTDYTNPETTFFFDIETPYGVITVGVHVTENKNCFPRCPDPMWIQSLPLGMTAEPMELEIAEGVRGDILIFPYNGF